MTAKTTVCSVILLHYAHPMSAARSAYTQHAFHQQLNSCWRNMRAIYHHSLQFNTHQITLLNVVLWRILEDFMHWCPSCRLIYTVKASKLLKITSKCKENCKQVLLSRSALTQLFSWRDCIQTPSITYVRNIQTLLHFTTLLCINAAHYWHVQHSCSCSANMLHTLSDTQPSSPH